MTFPEIVALSCVSAALLIAVVAVNISYRKYRSGLNSEQRQALREDESIDARTW